MRDQVVSRCLPESAHWRGTDRETGLMGSDEPHEGGCTRHTSRVKPRTADASGSTPSIEEFSDADMQSDLR